MPTQDVIDQTLKIVVGCHRIMMSMSLSITAMKFDVG